MRLASRRKYGNKPTAGSASKREAKRLAELRLLERAGEIKDLRTQAVFELIPPQRRNGKCVERAVKYIADFVYVRDGKLTVEDAKGIRTTPYVIKRKLMLFIHGVQVKEV